MSNIMGKALRECKKVWDVVCSSASEVGSVVGEATKGISGYASLVMKIAMKKSEIEEKYSELGKLVYEDGLTPDNEQAFKALSTLYDLNDDLNCLEDELEAYSDEDGDEDWDSFGYGKEADWNLEDEDCHCDDETCHCGDDDDDDDDDDEVPITFEEFMEEMKKIYKETTHNNDKKNI